MKRRDKLAGGRWRLGALLWATAMLAVGALVLAGCGGSSGGSSTDTSATASTGSSGAEGSTAGGGAPFEVSDEDRQCLKEKGVELPEFKPGEGPQTFQKGEMPEGAESGQMPEGGEMPGGRETPEGGEMPQGGPPAGGLGGEEMTKAFAECGVEMPELKGGPGGATAGTRPNVNSAAFKKQVKEYVACVRENGYELAEPDFSGEGPIFEKVESESAAFKQASEQCQSLLGGPQSSGSEGETEES
jgi:hypothetical protein